MDSGIFCISLDFELLWGIFDKVGTNYHPNYFKYTRQIVPDMLDVFAKNQVEATWATVGMLFAENEEEWEQYSPIHKPSYREPKLSAYEFVKKTGIKPEVHFAPELIRQIINTPGQELGSHTFAHYYTLMRGQSPDQFRQDLQATQKISQEKFGINLKSLVFPRNHINELYLPICLEEGYTQARSNPKSWFWQETQHEDLSKKWFRSADCFMPIGKTTTFSEEEMRIYPNEPLLIPASRIFRPISKNNKVFNSVRLSRIKSEMSYAAEKKEIYHLWWHPHNFANDPIQSMIELQELMVHYQFLKSEYGMESKNMEGIGKMVRNVELKV
ncbi:polysaccharide deacetylase family protein [Algoriphagus aestuarii]|nr:polysaccharide deacetylase family protein [Algoriphagus aestuarii]